MELQMLSSPSSKVAMRKAVAFVGRLATGCSTRLRP